MLIRVTDPAHVGDSLVVLVVNADGEILNTGTQEFGAREDGTLTPMTELAPDLPGMFVADVVVPNVADLLYRIEVAADPDQLPVSTGSLATLEGRVSNLDDILAIVIPGSGVDGSPDITIGRYLLEELSFGKGWVSVNKATREHVVRLIGTNEVIRTRRVVDDEAQAALVPPDAAP